MRSAIPGMHAIFTKNKHAQHVFIVIIFYN